MKVRDAAINQEVQEKTNGGRETVPDADNAVRSKLKSRIGE